MSVVPSIGPLRRLYQDASLDIEHRSSRFWQVWLQRTFHEDAYWVLCEMPPDQSLRRVDAVVERTNDLESVYVMTTVGVSFRVWSVYGSDLSSLVPFQGGQADATQSQYVNADSYEAEVLSRFVETVKAYPPLRRAPVIPTPSTAGGYGQASSAGDQFIKVHVSRVGHFGRLTEYVFSDVNGNQKRSTKDDWREVTYKGKAAWINSRRGITYYARDRIG
ncbi:hypothetical protein FAGAP_12792 [Fusarium agapanthi]|uniref:Uncharacterized protein n=1 Tax=Fusarium agapanthi TaxID=1803897 RepID=A0A9P5AZ76_9HYPO|nr:hypothetical protein FAGAP_12792 [Fusarium agapanthi]